ncbi:MAG: Holliday junction resolvase RuvX [bacterium]|nr:Holliday junction resolvase RuvX [candidate division WOR-3 bacterium]
MGRILCLDLGERRVGLAISDETQTIAQSLDTITFKNEPDLIATLKRIAAEHNISEIVIGNPISLAGKKTKRSNMVDSFQAKLQKFIDLPIKLFDERFTSQLAIRILSETYRKPHRKKAAIDKLAATIILEDYIAAKNKN